MEALVYGYLRDDLAAGDGDDAEAALRELAAAHGFCFAATFREPYPGDGTAFAELTRELQRAEAHHVVVPSLEHLTGQIIPREKLIAKLADDAAARIWSVAG